MVTRTGGMGISGVASLQETIERRLIWGGPTSMSQVLMTDIEVISGATRDAGSTPTTDIRAGLLMGKVTSTGELEEWDADATDGTEDLHGVMPFSFRAIDWDANNADRDIGIIVRAPLIADQLLIQGTVLTSHADEFLARRNLGLMGCVLNDDPQQFKSGLATRFENVTGTTKTITEAENGTTFTAANAASTNFTLPAIHVGLRYTILRVGDEELVITSPEGNNIIGDNDAAATTVTYTTASQHIGAYVDIECILNAGTPAWMTRSNEALTRAFA